MFLTFRNVRYLFLIPFITLLIFIGCSDKNAETDELKNQLQITLDSLRSVSGFPGATLAVVIGGKEYQLASGLADIEMATPMKPTDRMFSGSVGKTFVSAVALQLVDEKKLGLENLISVYLGEEDWFLKLPNANEITVRMLMNHTSGLPRYILKQDFWNDFNSNVDRVWKPEELLSYIFDEEPIHPAGKGWAYSDTDYIILGMIIEKITANKFYDELSNRILLPYTLENTTPSVSRDIDGLVSGYTGDGTPPFNLPGKVIVDGRYVINPQFEWTGGGLVTNSLDLAKWAKFLYTGNVLPEYMRVELMSPVDEKNGQPSVTGYGLGVQVWTTDDGLVYGHGGIFPGYLTQIYYISSLNAFIAMQINTDTLSGKLDRPIGRILAAVIPVIKKYL